MSEETKQPASKSPEESQPVKPPVKPPPPPEVQVTAPPPTPENMEKWLWVDPYLTEEKLKKRPIVGCVLLADEIINYISNYNVLVDKADYECGNSIGAKLKGASYTMTPDEMGAWIYRPSASDGADSQETIIPEKDDAGAYYLVPKNALVYIKIKQRLRIPFYIIGRHNLKIRYVYQGLLLGTGPQVDPGFCGNLIIPLHNFTTRDVKIYIEQSFISIDFTRTTELSFDGRKVPDTIDELYDRYSSEKHLIERVKVTQRNSISKYLEGASPRSQMGQFQYDFGALEKKVNLEFVKIETTTKHLIWERIAVIFSLISFLIAVGALTYASLNYYRGFVADFKSETERVKNITSNTNIASIENRVLRLESNAEMSSIETSNLIQAEVLKQLASQKDQIQNITMSPEELNELHKIYERDRMSATNGIVK